MHYIILTFANNITEHDSYIRQSVQTDPKPSGLLINISSSQNSLNKKSALWDGPPVLEAFTSFIPNGYTLLNAIYYCK